MKKIWMIAMVFALTFLTACSPQPLQTIGAAKYYVQIEEDGEAFTEFDNTRYEYNLVGYDKEGEAQTLQFTANHQLKKDAYLIIYYKKDEVITYQEVTREEVPEAAYALLSEED